MTDDTHDHGGTVAPDTQVTRGRRGLNPILLVFIVAVIATNLLDGQIIPVPIRVVLDMGLVGLAIVHGIRWYASRSNHD
jgi:hypothetical protein